ncbi:Ig domain-containing protein [Salmonella enterica]|nr:Ig domain-containing protein [Salmonella enterica]
MPEQKMKITEEAFSDYTGHMCRAVFTNSISNESLSERQQNYLAACLQAVPFTQALAITPTSPSVLVGKTVQLNAGISMSKSSGSFTWKSANAKIATISASGLVTGIAPGAVQISVTDSETKLSSTVELIVKSVSVESVSITPNSTTVNKGETVTLAANVVPDNATNKKVTWTSKNPEFATIDQSGVVTGIAAGVATIEITSEDGSHKATATVEVAESPAA